MKTPSRRKLVLGIAGGATAFALALGGASAALAEDPTPAPSTSNSAQSGAVMTHRHDQHRDELAAALAKELGINQDKVAAALDKIDSARPQPPQPDRQDQQGHLDRLKTRLDGAVKAGTITQADEDAILKAAQAGVLMPGPHGHGR